MKNVKRRAEPASLVKNAQKWENDLINALTLFKKGGQEVKESLFNRYNKPDVKDALIKMYKGMCCYCETEIGVVSYEHIEHRKPKSLFPAMTFNWDNLHLSCPKCNIEKLNKWNSNKPILDAVLDVPIDRHLTYKSTGTGLRRWAKSERGKVTINHCKLNRSKLKISRTYVFTETIGSVMAINAIFDSGTDIFEANNLISELKDKTKGSFGTVIKFAMDNLLKVP